METRIVRPEMSGASACCLNAPAHVDTMISVKVPLVPGQGVDFPYLSTIVALLTCPLNRMGPVTSDHRRITGNPAIALLGVVLAFLSFSSLAFAQTLSENITLSGEIRVRGEADNRTSGTDPDAATLLRTRISLFATPSSKVSAFIQISDSRIFGEELNTLTDASADRLDLHQAYLAWKPWSDVTLRIGRQELAFADQRLVGTVNWANVTRAFDGLKATVDRGSWTLDAFAMVLTENDATLATGLNPRQNEGEDTDRTFFGTWFKRGPVELFALADRNASTAAFDNIDRYTLGAQGVHTLGSLSIKGMAAAQLGRQTPTAAARQDIAAYMLTGNVSYALQGELRPTLAVQADYLSGDKSPLDDTHSTFNTLYATNHAFYGYMDLFLAPSSQTGFLGLFDTMLRASVRPGPWTVRSDLHRFQLGRKAPSGERNIGVELDVTAGRVLAPGLTLLGGFGVFEPNSGAAAAGLGDDNLQWAFLQAMVRF